MLRPALIFILVIALTLAVSASALYSGLKSGELKKNLLSPIEKSLVNLNEALKSSPTPPPLTSNYSVSSSASSEVKVNSNQDNSNSHPQTPPEPARACNRYTVPHLDGSTSARCYSASDYNQLVSLGYDLSSAKTFYQFHVDGAQNYQDQYDRSHSSVYLDAKASEDQQAKRENDKIGQITLQMQQIEARGY